MKHYYIVLILAFGLFSCEKDNSTFDIISYANKAIDFSDIIDTTSYVYIPLASDSIIIGDIGKAAIVDSSLFILDNKLKIVQQYDLNGNHIRNVGRQGRGPGEYIDVSNFLINYNDNQIIITDGSTGNALFFDYNGNHIKSCRMGINPLAYLPQMKEYVTLSSPMETPERYELRRFKECSDIPIVGYIPHPDYKEKAAYFVNDKYFLQQGEKYFFIPAFSDDLYCLSDDGLELVYEFGFQNAIFDYDREGIQALDYMKYKKLGPIENFFINNRGSYMFTVMYGSDVQFDVVGNINTKSIQAGGKITEIPTSVSFAFNPVGVFNEFFISSITYAYLYPSYFPDATEDDNPILVLFKLKIDD